ncbi:hypothetical protein [Sphingomonas sp. Leaf257]|uniref:hypothetical protein n=1 Tax=Sphingomonas sp. Leaf257 TaxID=1736309 RepID=UPI0006F7CE4E|nr:hypothetical protein [Sphingomonas sp. Leaf257]KQO50614.1 hypothetical protein ASF14_11050 [Sphingomonas sp. Leaf257]
MTTRQTPDAVREAIIKYTQHHVGCAVYGTWVHGEPKCSCGLDEARNALAALDSRAVMNAASDLRDFADQVMEAAANCCTDPDAGPSSQTSVSFTGEEGARIANDLHRLIDSRAGDAGEGPINTGEECPVCHAIFAIWPSANKMVCHCQTHPWFPAAATPAPAVDASEELRRGKDEIRSLIESIWRAEFSKDAPNWKPLDDLPGMISQMDNMYAGVRSQRDKARWDLHNPPAVDAHEDNPARPGEWDHRYRPLAHGEIIAETDECRRDDGTWITGVCVGQPAPDPAYTSHRVYRRLKSPAVDAVPAGEVDTYTRWLAGDETLPTLSREQYLRFQARSDRAIKDRQRTPKTVADRVAEVRRNPDDPDWDNCPACKVGSLDTGYECNACGFDAQPLVHFRDACEARGERMHPSGLYESEIANPFHAALSHGEGRK